MVVVAGLQTENKELAAAISAYGRAVGGIPLPTSPSGSTFVQQRAGRERILQGLRSELIKKGFSESEVTSAVPRDVRPPTTKTPGSVERRQARLKPFQKKQREEAIAKAVERGEVVVRSPAELEKIKAGLVSERALQTMRKQEILARARKTIQKQREAEIKKKEQVLPQRREAPVRVLPEQKGFVAPKPIPRQETVSLAPPKIFFPQPKKEKTFFDIGGTISAGGLKPLKFTEGQISEQQIVGLQQQARRQKIEQTQRAFQAGGAAAAKAELFSTGIPKLVESVPAAAAFGALFLISPPVAAVVGTIALTTSIPGFQEEISKKGLLRTAVSEAPSLALFSLAAGGGVRGRVVVRKVKFEFGLKQFEKKITEKGVGFDPAKEIFVPTGKRVVDLRKGTVTIETEAVQRGFPVFGEAGEIVGRQLQLKPRFKPEFEPQAEFMPEALGKKRIEPGVSDFIGKFFEKPLSPDVKQAISTPIRGIADIKPSIQTRLRTLKPGEKPLLIEFQKTQEFVGGEVFQLGGLLPPIRIPRETPFERFGGELFERIPKPKVEAIEKVQSRIIKRPRIKTSIVPALETAPVSAQRAVVRLQPVSAVTPAQLLRPMQIVRPTTAVLPEVKIGVRQSQIPIIDTKPREAVAPLLDVPPLPIAPGIPPGIPIGKPPTVPKLKPPKKVPGEKPPKVPVISLFEPKRFIMKKKQPGYNAVVKKRSGKFVRVNEKPLPPNIAFNRGARVADNTVARSFRVVKSGKKTDIQDVQNRPLEMKFRPRVGKTKLPRGTYVEKSRHAIDSTGELFGITAKGIEARKNQVRLF